MKINIQVAVTLLAALHVATAKPEPPVPGQNAYLPPTTGGYQYNKPSTTFTYPPPTQPPVYTTRPPVYTTRPPVYTTRPPVYTTRPPVYTTRPPVYTTRPPIYTQPPPSYGPPQTTYRPPATTPRPDYGVPDGNRPSIVKPSYGPPTVTPGGHEHHHHHEPGMPFDFNYAVQETDPLGRLNDYSHNAVSNGDAVNGEYRVLLPDGRVQVVKYTADWATGYHAQVSYEGGNGNPFNPNPQY